MSETNQPTNAWHRDALNRRAFLQNSTNGLGIMVLGSLLRGEQAIGSPLGKAHFAPKAKRVIFLCMAGGPSHLETFDYKPQLANLDGKPMPESFTKGQPIAQLQKQQLKCLGPIFKFRKHGQSGQEISDILPGIAGIADDLSLIHISEPTRPY